MGYAGCGWSVLRLGVQCIRHSSNDMALSNGVVLVGTWQAMGCMLAATLGNLRVAGWNLFVTIRTNIRAGGMPVANISVLLQLVGGRPLH